jgi:cysteine desulfurase / selenocysteine lyase
MVTNTTQQMIREINIDAARADTPGCSDKLFFNSAGSSLPPRVVNETIAAYLAKEEMVGGYKLREQYQQEIEGFYTEAAHLLNCGAHNIAFAHDATDAYSKALSSIPFAPGDVLITTGCDYASNNIQFISLQRRYGIVVKRIGTTENGDLNIAHFEQLVAEGRPRLVAITHVPTNSGLVQDVAAIGAVCARENLLLLVDACQSVGQLPVDVQQLQCDFLTATGRKFLRGPRGTGLLYVSDKALQQGLAPLLIDGGGARWTGENDFRMLDTAKRFQTWEAPYALILGLKAALQYLNNLGIHNTAARNQQLVLNLRKRLTAIPGVELYDRGSNTCSIITLRKAGKTQEQLKTALDNANVFFGISTLEWGLLDFTQKGIDWAIRFSPHYFNTDAEADLLAAVVESV